MCLDFLAAVVSRDEAARRFLVDWFCVGSLLAMALGCWWISLVVSIAIVLEGMRWKTSRLSAQKKQRNR